ncbi:MAG: hypothetical protein WCX27_00145 [Candidatus Paceibacterota bacterium]|jgi:hypothetical protein
MNHKLTLKSKIDFEELKKVLRTLTFRGIYDKKGEKLKPYENAKFTLTTVYPPKSMCDSPTILSGKKKETLFSPQPTIYLNQLDIIKTVDEFLKGEKMRVHQLEGGIGYDWEGRDSYHMIPPIVEKHTYDLKNGYVDLDKLVEKFEGYCVKDAQEYLHKISNRYLQNFNIDEVSAIRHLDIFNSNAPIINYGVQYNGPHDFYIVCDGSHRIDYATEYLNEPINVILVEPQKNTSLVPYYAFPMPFRPTIRLSSKRSEKMYPRLERDKIHLFNDFLKKVLHYDWSNTKLNISRLRSNIDIF